MRDDRLIVAGMVALTLGWASMPAWEKPKTQTVIGSCAEANGFCNRAPATSSGTISYVPVFGGGGNAAYLHTLNGETWDRMRSSNTINGMTNITSGVIPLLRATCGFIAQ